jgi:integrase
VASIRERTKTKRIRTKDGETFKTVPVFHVQVRLTGFPARTASFPTRRAAERWATTIEADMIEGKHFRGVEARRRTLREAIDRYLDEELPKKRDGGMHRSYLPWWREAIGHLKLSDVTAATLVDCRAKLAKQPFTRAKPTSPRTTVKAGEKAREFKRAPGTVKKYLACLRHVFTVARKEWHWASHNPFDDVSMPKASGNRVRYLSTDERAALLAQTAADQKLHTFVVLALSTACRAGELVNLRWRDVDLTEGRLLFRLTKNDEGRAAWLHGEALRLMTEHAKVRPLDSERRVFESPEGNKYDYLTPFKEAMAAAKVASFRFHDLRHSAATYLAMEGATEAQLRAIGGWKSGVVRQYVHIAAQDAKSVVAKMNRKILGGES